MKLRITDEQAKRVWKTYVHALRAQSRHPKGGIAHLVSDLLDIIDRAQRTLGPQPSEQTCTADVLTAEERAAVERNRRNWSPGGAGAAFLRIIDRVAPKPAPAKSPLDALLSEMGACVADPDDRPFDGGYAHATSLWLHKLRTAIAAERGGAK